MAKDIVATRGELAVELQRARDELNDLKVSSEAAIVERDSLHQEIAA